MSAVLANYRHYPQVKMPGFMDDAARAALVGRRRTPASSVRIAQRLYLMGHSAGAHLAALVALDPRYFAAAGSAHAARRRRDRLVGTV